MAEKTKVLPCPHCFYETAKFSLGRLAGRGCYYCDKCGMQGPYKPNAREALEAWNKLPRPEDVQELWDRLGWLAQRLEYLCESFRDMTGGCDGCDAGVGGKCPMAREGGNTEPGWKRASLQGKI